ncbi:MAG TPA: dihydroorotase [Gammaproteobacteria bacterium]|nr:dihydroorotase [Gammaproteobacteria bacterium]
MNTPAASSQRLRITGGRVIDPANGLDAIQDLYTADGRVVALGRAPEGFSADREIDAAGRVVCPGLVDLCARLREPGEEHKATVASETRAAAAGGITTLCCPPDTRPVIDTPAVLELLRQRADATGAARVVAVGALTRGLGGERLSEMAALKDAGCVGVSNGRHALGNTLIQRRAFEYAATFGLTVFVHAEDHWLANSGCAHEGAIATRLGLPGIPEAAETAAVARDLALVAQTGVRVHFCRLTTAPAVRMVARAQFDGLPVTADAAVPYIHLTEMDIADFNSLCHVNPPLRTQRDQAGLREGIARGTLSAVCSDHQPHEPDAKLAPFPATEPGISGLDTLLPLTLRLVQDRVLDLPEAIARLTWGPARILGLPCGTLSPGAAADVCVFDPDEHWQPAPADLHSAGHNTPFLGWPLTGRVTHTLLAGNLVFQRQAAGGTPAPAG